MSTKFFNDQWRIPSNENQNKVSNYSMDLDGTSDYIDIGQIDITGTKSVAFWIYPTASGDDGGIFTMVPTGGTSDLLSIALWQSNIQALTEVGVKQKSLQTISINTWYHVVVIKSTNSITKIYIDGVDQTLNTGGTWNGTPANPQSKIGEATFASDYNFTGKIDQVCVFDYALSATQVSTLYGGGTTVVNPMSLNPKPVAYYQLGDQSADNGANYLSPNGSLQDYVFASGGSLSGSIDLANPVALGTNKTVSFWFKLSSASTVSFSPFTSIVNSGNCYYPYFISSSPTTLKWYVSDSACTGGSSLNIGTGGAPGLDTWAHAAVVGDGSSIKCYLNGVEVQTSADDRNPTIQRLIYGMASQVEFSNFSIFNTNLPATGTESITSLYNNGVPPDLTSYSDIIHWYKLNAEDTFDGTNWTVIDSIGSNNGTSSGMTSANLVQSNLQHVSGYSPYALDFDGVDDVIDCGNDSSLQITGAMTVSYWFKGQGGSAGVGGVGKIANSPNRGFMLSMNNAGLTRFYIAPDATSIQYASTTITPDGKWHHLVGVYNPSTSIALYLDNAKIAEVTAGVAASQYNGANNLQIGARGDSTGFFDGGISNVAIWNTNLSTAELTEIYNQGVPSNLNTFSGTAPISWWQVGSNSSFNTNWTCLDEIGTNNGTSVNMTNDDITNGPGYSANGLGTSSIVIKGDAPYSTSNALSENMDVLDRTTDIPS